MSKYKLPFFEEINTNELKDCYQIYINFENNKVELDLNFKNNSINTGELIKIKDIIENIIELNKQNISYIIEDYEDEDGDTTKLYVEHHIEEIDEEEFSKMLKLDKNDKDIENKVLKKIKLQRIGFYPESKSTYAIFDYGLGSEITDCIIVLYYDNEGDFKFLTLES